MIHLLPEWLIITLEAASLIGSVLVTLTGAALWAMRNTLVTKADLNARMEEHEKRHARLDTRLAHGEQRFAVVESEMKHLPQADDIKALMVRVGGIEQGMASVGAQIEGLREVLERVERPLNVLIDHQLKREDR